MHLSTGIVGEFFQEAEAFVFSRMTFVFVFFPARRLHESAEMSRLDSPLFFECTALFFSIIIFISRNFFENDHATFHCFALSLFRAEIRLKIH